MAVRRRSSRRNTDRDYRRIEQKVVPVSELEDELKIVLYGKSGTGKTTLACDFPKPLLLIDIKEKGTDSVWDIPGVHVVRPQSWDEFEDVYWYLKKSDNKFKSVAIDTVSKLQTLGIEDHKGSKSKKGKPVGWWGTMTRRDWGAVSGKLQSWLHDFKELPMNVIFIAQDKVFNIEDEELEEGEISPEVGPRLMPSVVATMNADVGYIGNTFIRERFIKTKKLTKRRVEFCMRIGPHAYYVTKIRKPKSIEVPAFIIDPTYQKLLDLKRGGTTSGRKEKVQKKKSSKKSKLQGNSVKKKNSRR